MVLVFIFCAIVIIITLLICLTVLSTLKIKIEDLALSNIGKSEKEASKDYKVIISLYIFNKIKWLSFHLNDKKMRRMYSKSKIENIDFKKVRKNFKLEDLKLIKKINPKISYFNLQVDVGTQDVIATSFIIFTISTLVSIILPYTMKKYDKDKYYYEIKPLYINQNVYKIKFNGIIEIKMVHIINIVYVFLKKRRVDKNERTSNRRSYGYSYE